MISLSEQPDDWTCESAMHESRLRHAHILGLVADELSVIQRSFKCLIREIGCFAGGSLDPPPEWRHEFECGLERVF
jgi:hypothetical protein